ncbi:50S ribosomal protein L24 [Acidisoma cellulosilytica]|uniref:Large ribosomal subunit protein uL24 n=1 Tax=Acidisoma cellulosilyticum TaxID=2802395 RepID=A0A964E3K4_9PROT|nr:50S ribosomal protein L24 [Acidisoma cellulosilyticum]MCB8880755.1 50S ribosomal protein L24 [Acidisoma cellulosilyticum]
MAARIRKGDRVLVISGSDKGKRGEVTQVLPKLNRAVVEGVAVVVKHQKPSRAGEQGGLVRRERAIDLSNLKLIDPTSDQPTRVGFRILEDGRKVRVAKKTGALIES